MRGEQLRAVGLVLLQGEGARRRRRRRAHAQRSASSRKALTAIAQLIACCHTTLEQALWLVTVLLWYRVLLPADGPVLLGSGPQQGSLPRVDGQTPPPRPVTTTPLRPSVSVELALGGRRVA